MVRVILLCGAFFIGGGETDMIPVWWLIPAIMVGTVIGFFLVCLVSANKDDRE